MGQTNVTFRIDEDIKQQADELFKSLGLNLSTAFNMFLRQSINRQCIPFEIAQPRYNPEMEAEILRRMKDLKEGKGIEHELIEGNE